jgi:hypothetical protein
MKDSVNYIDPIYRLSLRDSATVPRRISYSQWSVFETCPQRWKLTYIDKLDTFTSSIDTCFGTAFHETIQEYLTTMYTHSVKRADSVDFRAVLTSKLKTEYSAAVQENGGQHFSNATQLGEYLEDGVAILEWFSKRRKQYFSTKDWQLVGIEIELCTQASQSNTSVYWHGFIDIVLRHVPTNTFTIIDVKTSRAGWNKHQKADSLKAAQLVAYKNYFSTQFGVPKDNINVEFFIVKRKLIEESMFPQKRIQQFKPAAGSVTQKKVQRQIDAFVEYCFDSEGERIADKTYMARSGKGDKNCKYCPFKTDYVNCPKEGRIRQ